MDHEKERNHHLSMGSLHLAAAIGSCVAVGVTTAGTAMPIVAIAVAPAVVISAGWAWDHIEDSMWHDRKLAAELQLHDETIVEIQMQPL
jgi:hypothetical protein